MLRRYSAHFRRYIARCAFHPAPRLRTALASLRIYGGIVKVRPHRLCPLPFSGGWGWGVATVAPVNHCGAIVGL